MNQMARWIGKRQGRLALVVVFFAQALARGETTVIGVIGDYGAAYKNAVSYSNEQAVANLVKSWNPHFIMTVGDNNYPNNEASNIDTNIGQFYHDYIYPYVGTYGAGATSNRFFPTIGNHDWALGYYGTNGLTPYLDYFTLPGNERYYNVRHGNLEIFAVASDQMEPDGATATSIQAMWLSNALAVSTATWRLVYFHASPYSSGRLHGTQTQESTNMLWPFKDWGASLILAGHDHVYERVETNGLTYFINGLGGDRIDSFYSPPTAGSQVRYNATYGAQRLDVTETNLTVRFINITNEVIDTYTLEVLPARLTPSLKANEIVVQIAGTSGRSYLTEASTNLVHWSPISTNRLQNGTATVTDARSSRSRFYRARLWR